MSTYGTGSPRRPRRRGWRRPAWRCTAPRRPRRRTPRPRTPPPPSCGVRGVSVPWTARSCWLRLTRTSLWHMFLSVMHNIPHYCLLLPHSALAAAELTLTVTTGTRSAASTCTHNILWRHHEASFRCTRSCLLELFDHVMIIKCDDFMFLINCDIALHWILQLDQFKHRKTLFEYRTVECRLEWIDPLVFFWLFTFH